MKTVGEATIGIRMTTAKQWRHTTRWSTVLVAKAKTKLITLPYGVKA